MFKKFKNILNNTQEWFALLGVINQLIVVFLTSLGAIFLSSLFIGSVETSYMIFVDPPALSIMKDESTGLFSSFILMILGLIITGFIISILSSSLENTFRNIRNGKLNYNGSDHTIIINYNNKIENILEELNLLHKDHGDIHDVIVLIDDADAIVKLQRFLRMTNKKFKNLKIFIRHGNTLSWRRYLDVSILSVHSIILLSDEKIKDNFVNDNHTLRIVSLLFNDENFSRYLKVQRDSFNPVKAIVELNNLDHSSNIVKHISSSLFLAVSPKTILSSILNLSMININFYNVWSELLSFKGHELYFISANEKNLVGQTYREVLLRQENGLLLGISRTEDSDYKLHLNNHQEIIKENDWLVFIAKDKHSISFKSSASPNKANLALQHPKEVYSKNILVIGDKQDISANELLDENNSKVQKISSDDKDLYKKDFYDNQLKDFDTIILNIDDEQIYRIALVLLECYKGDIPTSILFLVDDTQIAKHLTSSKIKNTILSHVLISKYITQVSYQLSLYNVFNTLFSKYGPEINFMPVSDFSNNLLDNLEQLKVELIYSNMVYVGCENHNGDIVFEADNLNDAKNIIVFCDGDF